MQSENCEMENAGYFVFIARLELCWWTVITSGYRNGKKKRGRIGNNGPIIITGAFYYLGCR